MLTDDLLLVKGEVTVLTYESFAHLVLGVWLLLWRIAEPY